MPYLNIHINYKYTYIYIYIYRHMYMYILFQSTREKVRSTILSHTQFRECTLRQTQISMHIMNIWQFFTENGTLQEINISHLGKRKIIFKMHFSGDMLVPWRATFPLCHINFTGGYEQIHPNIIPTHNVWYIYLAHNSYPRTYDQNS